MKGSQRDKSEKQEGQHRKRKPSERERGRERERRKRERQTQQHDHGRVQQDTDRDIPKWSQNQAATNIARTQERQTISYADETKHKLDKEIGIEALF